MSNYYDQEEKTCKNTENKNTNAPTTRKPQVNLLRKLVKNGEEQSALVDVALGNRCAVGRG